MAKLPKKRQASESSFDLVPECNYVVKIVKSEIKPGKNNNSNQVLHITMKIIEGKQRGRTIRDFFNIINSNPEAERIGNENLDNVAYAVFKKEKEYKNTTELHGVDIEVDVKIDGKYNRVVKYSPIVRKKKKKGKKNESPW